MPRSIDHFQAIVGKDGKPNAAMNEQTLALKVRGDTNELQIELFDDSNTIHGVRSLAPLASQPVVLRSSGRRRYEPLALSGPQRWVGLRAAGDGSESPVGCAVVGRCRRQQHRYIVGHRPRNVQQRLNRLVRRDY